MMSWGMGLPIRMSEAGIGFEKNAPILGEHNLSIYKDYLHFSEKEILELEQKRAI